MFPARMVTSPPKLQASPQLSAVFYKHYLGHWVSSQQQNSDSDRVLTCSTGGLKVWILLAQSLKYDTPALLELFLQSWGLNSGLVYIS